MGKGRIKIILRLCLIEFFDKGEGRHKIIQAVSPSFFGKREKRDTKRIQAVSHWRILFGKGRMEWKWWITQVFEQRNFLGRESFEQKLLERWREKNQKNSVERNQEDRLKDRMIERNDGSILNSCHGHIFIIFWWLKSKFVTLGNFF